MKNTSFGYSFTFLKYLRTSNTSFKSAFDIIFLSLLTLQASVISLSTLQNLCIFLLQPRSRLLTYFNRITELNNPPRTVQTLLHFQHLNAPSKLSKMTKRLP